MEKGCIRSCSGLRTVSSNRHFASNRHLQLSPLRTTAYKSDHCSMGASTKRRPRPTSSTISGWFGDSICAFPDHITPAELGSAFTFYFASYCIYAIFNSPYSATNMAATMTIGSIHMISTEGSHLAQSCWRRCVDLIYLLLCLAYIAVAIAVDVFAVGASKLP